MCSNPLPRQGPRRRETPAWICFAAVITIFVAQCWYLSRNSEPYPALVLPSFSGVMLDSSGSVSGLSADVTAKFKDGTTKTFGIDQLFTAAPSSHWQFMSRIMFYPKDSTGMPGSKTPSAIKTWIKQHVLPGFVLSRIRRHVWNGVDPETKQWMDGQLARLYPGETAAAATINWFTTTYSRKNGKWESSRNDTKHVEVSF